MPRKQAVQDVRLYIEAIMNYLKQYRKFYHDLYLKDLQILFFIHRSNEQQRVTVTQLAKHLNITPAASSQLISSYENKNWVERVHSQTARRTVYIQLSKYMLDLLQSDIDYLTTTMSEQLNSFSDEDLESFSKVLSIINKNLLEDAVFFHKPEQEV